jgi:hypothetical protein
MLNTGPGSCRIPDPAHVNTGPGSCPFRKGWARGEERNTDNHRRRSPIKNVCSRPINFFFHVPTRWDPVLKTQ